MLTHSINAPADVLLAKGPQIVEAVAGGPLRTLKPFTPEVRAEIDNELVAKSIEFMKRQTTAGKPFFLYLPFSMGHIPNLPSSEFKGKSRIGNYGDKLMEGDYHVGQILDALKQFGVDNNTLLVFASDNGPSGEDFREYGNSGTPDMGNPGPFRGELGEVTEGSIRTFCFIRWPGHVKPNSTSYAMFSIMDFFPTFASIIGATAPSDRPIDGVDQTDVLLGKSATGKRDSLLSFIGGDLVAVRWKQWRMYFTDVHPTGIGPQREPGIFSASAPLAGYPLMYNIEMDPHEDLVVAGMFGWAAGSPLEVVEKYTETLKKYPNPPAPNLTKFCRSLFVNEGSARLKAQTTSELMNYEWLWRTSRANTRIRLATNILTCLFLIGASSALAQQKPQWMPGQVGLNAGILPSPGFTYANITTNYDADAFNGPKGNAIPVSGTYNVWAVEDIFYYVFNGKVFGGNCGMMVMFPTPATGSLVADISNPNFPNLSAAGGGSGLADLWIQPFSLGWHFKRADLQVMDAFMVPTGRYTPGASNNVGSPATSGTIFKPEPRFTSQKTRARAPISLLIGKFTARDRAPTIPPRHRGKPSLMNGDWDKSFRSRKT